MPRLFPSLSAKLRQPGNWLSLVGLIGVLLAFGHSILAMSGEETLAQVYREVESPKLPNFKKAAFIVFVYSLVLTAGVCFLAVLLIPDEIRMKDYSDNLIGGLAMHVVGPPLARLLLNAFVVVVGFLILAGAVNTAIIGSNGVLNRVAEDGVLPDWFLKPHRRFGTTYRVLYLIVGLQLLTILLSRGNMYVLGEAYAFGVVWSFVFKALAMVVLRFRDRSPREFKVPFNIHIGNVEFPVGLIAIFLILLVTAVLNFFTKEVASISGVAFTVVFLVLFMTSEYIHEKRRGAAAHQHLEQFNETTAEEISPASLGLTKPYRKLVAIRSPQNLFMLEKALSETDPETTEVVVMTAKFIPPGGGLAGHAGLRSLRPAVDDRRGHAGREGRQGGHAPDPAHQQPAVRHRQHGRHTPGAGTHPGRLESVFPRRTTRADRLLLDQVHQGVMEPLTVRILSRNRDVYLDLGGGNRIPKISERQARSVAELRSAGVGISHAMLVHTDTPESSDLFKAVLTMIDPQVALTVVPVPLGESPGAEKPPPAPPAVAQATVTAESWVQKDIERAGQLRREVAVAELPLGAAAEEELVRLAAEQDCDVLIIGLPSESSPQEGTPLDTNYIVRHASCWVCLVSWPTIPQDAEVEPAKTGI